MKRIYALLLGCCAALGVSAQTIYVRASASGLNNGSSWINAFTSLDAALTAAAPGQQIWVAAGTYRPNDILPNNSLVLPTGVELYGGFAGTETALSQRNLPANPTILSGDLAGNDVPGNFTQNRADNSRHVLVVVTATAAAPAVVDGFEIRGGQTLAADSLTADDLQGAGIYALARLTVRNCRFTDNFAYGGAGISAYGVTATGFVADNCVFEQNTATEQAAGIFMFGLDNGQVKKCVFRNNTTSRGCLYPNFSIAITADSCLFENNTAGADQYCAGMFSWQSDFTLTNSTFRGNQAGNAGAMYCDGRDGDNFFTLDNCRFENNTVSGFGGAVFTWQADFLVNRCTFLGNEADNAAAMYNDGRDGISTFQIKNSHFENNSVSGYGGPGLYNWYGDFEMDSTVFLNNESAYTAGAVYNANSHALIRTCTFDGNNATFGGAMANYNAASDVTLEDCQFLNNEAETSGGAIINGFLATATLRNSMFQSNLAGYGGAVYSQNDSTRLTVEGCMFNSNSGGNFGGALHASGGVDLTVRNSHFEANTGGFGGAISISEDSLDLARLIVESSVFQINFALTQAGALNVSNADVTLTNCLFVNNTNLGTGAGGAISNNASDGKTSDIAAINCTFADNQATLGAGIAQWEDATIPGSDATLTLQNCILQHPAGLNYEIEAGEPAVISLGGNLSSDGSLLGELSNTQDVNFTETSFVDAFNLNYHLLNGDGSTLDGGIAAGAPTLDLDGNPRLGAPDKGAYEFGTSGAGAPASAVLPLSVTPNPARDFAFLNLENALTGTVQVQIFNAEGQLVRALVGEKTNDRWNLRTDLRDLPAGQYQVRAVCGGRVFAGWLVKQ